MMVSGIRELYRKMDIICGSTSPRLINLMPGMIRPS